METLEGLIFDLDGTLIDSVEAHLMSWVKAMKAIGCGVDQTLIKRLIGKRSEDIAKALLPRGDEEDRRALREFKRKLYYDEFFPKMVRPFPEALKTLSMINDKGIDCAIASSVETKTVVKIAKQFGFDKYAKVLVGSDEVERGKPFPDLFLETSRRLGVSPLKCMVVGDTVHDVEAGKAAGMITVAIVREKLMADDVVLAGPDWIIGDLRGLVQILKSPRNPA
jgi:HAD superfamily hydrolase (TIGR01509 family)